MPCIDFQIELARS